MKGRKPPAKLSDHQPKYVRLTDAPARIRLDVKPVVKRGRVEIGIAVEEYEVPEEGGEVVGIEPRRPEPSD